MSLSQKIAAALDENTIVHAPPCLVVVEDGPSRLALDLAAVDSVGVALSSLEFTTALRAEGASEDSLSPDALRAWGDRLAARVTYLMEPLKVFEVDASGGGLQLRSQSPTSRDDRRGYYEVRLAREGTLQLVRYAFDEAGRTRREVPCQLTREVLERLADDLAASAG